MNVPLYVRAGRGVLRDRLPTVLLSVVVVLSMASVAFAEEPATAPSRFFQTPWSLLPPVIAIGLALITKEVYTSLFAGIVAGGLLWSDLSFEGTLVHVFKDGIVASLSDAYNVGILVFLVILGIMVMLIDRSGGSAAFGRWASRRIRTRKGAQLATIGLGLLIFIDDYFNCLTVGSVMRPVADESRISRAKLAYLVDATAAPICIIAPVSSWAAAVSSYVEEGNGLWLFIQAIPFNFYALLTLVMMVALAVGDMDFGPMAQHEGNARDRGDVLSGMASPSTRSFDAASSDMRLHGMKGPEMGDGTIAPMGQVVDLVLPVLVLIVSCVAGMLWSGGYAPAEGVGFVQAFSDSDASVGLMLGSAVTLAVTFVYYVFRRSMPFRELAACIPDGFKSMVPAILILTFAWSLKAMTDSLGAKQFVEALVQEQARGLQAFLPAIVFLIACFLSFATGTSWGTFGILIPITLGVFPLTAPLGIVCVSACMAGAVCGDHCSPISDTTIMASAGAQCDHVVHVSTQLPYAVTVACVSFVTYVVAGFIPSALVVLPIGVILTLGTLFVIGKRNG